ncbi:MAG: nitrate- and nitrite sensing domain-containing protein [Methylococcales bacterium]|jgi:methyl-accepting chemotaxis protein|nr:nitrate- and nitrite sensing domain-containing protein [Methylococcales bacterium]MBT7409273.1 nitrate- and nitrite sensing domain-containing protein [Methylococcales bacterium]
MSFNFLNQYKIKTKFTLALALPIIGLIISSLININNNWQHYQNENNIIERFDFSATIAQLLNSLQKERGLTAGFMGSSGKKQGEQLKNQRSITDNKNKEFNQFIEHISNSAITPKLQIQWKSIQQKLKSISTLRSKIDNLSTNSDFFNFYSDINASLVELIKKMGSMVNDTKLAEQSIAYTNLLILGEKSGQERALNNSVFTKRTITTNQYKQTSSYIDQQNNAKTAFMLNATDQQHIFHFD